LFAATAGEALSALPSALHGAPSRLWAAKVNATNNSVIVQRELE
jgi:hypothetical protein